MAPAPGTYELGPDTGTLELRTYRDGLAQAAGHDLVLAATRWHGTAELAPPEVRVEVAVDLTGLAVREGTGGLVPLGDGDRAEILRHLRRTLATDRHPEARFTATATVPGDHATTTPSTTPSTTLSGELALAGRTAPLDVRVDTTPDGVTGSASVRQTAWGVRPYSGLFGALKVRDEVTVTFALRLG